jgi:CubicO group peptidase (beta-lactamase class C family)
MRLEKRMDLGMAELDLVRQITRTPWFSGMVVIRGQHVLYERYARDFHKDIPHSIQSITKSMTNLIIGRLVESHALDLSLPVSHFIPEMGTGYADATLQQVLNMDVLNEYSEDFADPAATYYRHEEAMGWRLPADLHHEDTQRRFILGLKSDGTKNCGESVQYKDANTDVLCWVAERVSGRPLRAFLADIVDASGLEGALHITTDREGFPTMDGGACLTVRDLARYFSIFVRRGRGISGELVGSREFIERTAETGISMKYPHADLFYSNHLMVLGRSIGHAGWAGQFVMGNLDTGTVAAFLSVTEDVHAIDPDYLGPVIRALEAVTGPKFGTEYVA